MYVNRNMKALLALKEGKKLAFDYMPIGLGRTAIEHRVVKPIDFNFNRYGQPVLTAEDDGRDGKPRSFRVGRAFHVQIV